MFEQKLKDKYQFLTEYFESGISHPTRALSHSILLYGNDIKAQYDLAVEISRLLNCHESKDENCHCINCNWVRDGQHPAVMTVSKIDNKPTDDESKTVISVKQSQMVKNLLLNTSDYHRVFIFCDAEIEDGVWTPHGLNQLNFHEETANSMLKIIEEPPENTTFFFLARDKNDLIGTIISRSQSFFVPSYESDIRDYSIVEEVFEDYPNLERRACFDIAQKLFELSKSNGAAAVLDGIQGYLLALLKSNLGSGELERKILRDIKLTENAKMQITARVAPQLAFEDLCLNITK